MDFRQVGRSGLRVSAVAYGNWISYTEGAAERTARAALDSGITTFDTADVYGGTRAEVVLGQAIKGVNRESLVICTKVFSPVGPGPNDRGLSRKHVLEAAENSLRRLGVDYIDVYYAHRYDASVPLRETLRAFDDLVRQGKVMYIAVSEWTAEQIADALSVADELGLDRIIANQPQYSMLWRAMESEVAPLCKREGLGQLAWSPLAQGLLTGKYSPGAQLPNNSRAAGLAASQFASKALSQGVLERVNRLADLAANAGLSLTTLAVAWVLSQPTIASAIVGATRPEQVSETAAAAGVTLDSDLLEEVDRTLGPLVERDPRRIPSQPGDYGTSAAGPDNV